MPIIGEDWVDEDHDSFEDLYRASEVNHDRLLRRLRRKLPPKMICALDKELESHQCMLVGIVGRKDVKGRRMRGSDHTGASTPIRHVFVDVSVCTYSETYTGDAYLYIGSGRYIQVQISG